MTVTMRGIGRAALTGAAALLVAFTPPGAPSVAASPAGSPAVDYSQPGRPQALGTGDVEEVTPDGRALVLSDVDKRFAQPGCEGVPDQILLRAPLDGSEREPLRSANGREPLKGFVVRGPGTSVALVQTCEEFLSGIDVGEQSASGHLGDVRAVPKDRLPATTRVQAWSPTGDALLAVALADDGASGDNTAVVDRIDLQSGEVTELARGAMIQAGELADGSLVLAENGQVRIRDDSGATKRAVVGDEFTISPDGRTIAVFGGRRLGVLTADGYQSLAEAPAGEMITGAVWTDAGDALAYVSEGSDSGANTTAGSVHVITDDAQRTDTRITDAPGRYARMAFSPAGDLLAFSRYPSDPQATSDEVFVVRFERPLFPASRPAPAPG